VRVNSIIFALAIPMLSLSGCIGYFIGEGPMMANLHNPITHEKAFCGVGMTKGPDWISGARTDRDKCVSALKTKGFELDCAEPADIGSAKSCYYSK
jgi:hypothetical protein